MAINSLSLKVNVARTGEERKRRKDVRFEEENDKDKEAPFSLKAVKKP